MIVGSEAEACHEEIPPERFMSLHLPDDLLFA
jgi:hypothetical protein